ncbi:MAG: iron-containing alcohol dehydrogenase, partial [Oscillospiraceae bacterium]
NPRLSLVYRGIDLCKKEEVDFILALGGGSVIDSAKAIGYGVVHDFDVWDLYDWKEKATGCLPVGAVLTIAAAGSEMSDSSVITKDEGGIKRGINSPYCRCKFAVMNPELTYTLPKYQTACGVTDILLHTMERYFVKESTMEMTDSIAEGLLRVVIKNGKILMKDPENYNARAEVMWAGSLSHNGLTNCGGGGDWSSHQLEHEL